MNVCVCERERESVGGKVRVWVHIGPRGERQGHKIQKPVHQLGETAFSLHKSHSRKQRKQTHSHHNTWCMYTKTMWTNKCKTGAQRNTLFVPYIRFIPESQMSSLATPDRRFTRTCSDVVLWQCVGMKISNINGNNFKILGFYNISVWKDGGKGKYHLKWLGLGN